MAKFVPPPDPSRKLTEEKLNALWQEDGSFKVQSSNGVDTYDVVILDHGGLKCECPAYEHMSECKHCRRSVYLMRVIEELFQKGKVDRTPRQLAAWERFLLFDKEHPEFYEKVLTLTQRNEKLRLEAAEIFGQENVIMPAKEDA